MVKYITILLTLLITFASCKVQNKMIDTTVVKQLDINRYLGKWYEIARFDHRFERGLIGVTATYSYRKDGKIKVVNSGYKKSFDGNLSEAIGKARIPNPYISSKLKVSFFWFFYGDYFVLELDDDYQWAVIGSSSDKYLWILSRRPQMYENLYNQLLKNLTNRGYDVTKLIKVKQKPMQ